MIICSLEFLCAVQSAPDVTSGIALYQASDPISGQTNLQGNSILRRKSSGLTDSLITSGVTKGGPRPTQMFAVPD